MPVLQYACNKVTQIQQFNQNKVIILQRWRLRNQAPVSPGSNQGVRLAIFLYGGSRQKSVLLLLFFTCFLFAFSVQKPSHPLALVVTPSNISILAVFHVCYPAAAFPSLSSCLLFPLPSPKSQSVTINFQQIIATTRNGERVYYSQISKIKPNYTQVEHQKMKYKRKSNA